MDHSGETYNFMREKNLKQVPMKYDKFLGKGDVHFKTRNSQCKDF